MKPFDDVKKRENYCTNGSAMSIWQIGVVDMTLAQEE